MAVDPSRTVDNSGDVSRLFPTDKLAERVLLASEGVMVEEVTGPGPAGVVALSQPAIVGSPVLMLCHDGAGAFAPGGPAPAALPVPVVPTHFTLLPANANDQAELTEAAGRNYGGMTLRVAYQPDQPEAARGGQHAVVPSDI